MTKDNLYNTTSITIKNIVGYMNWAYKTGQTLKSIYDNTCDVYKEVGYAQAVFHEFVKKNIGNEKFMSEFNKTCFMENIHNDKASVTIKTKQTQTELF